MKRNQKTIHTFMSLVVMSVALFAPSQGFASDTDARIESSAKDTYVFNTFLKDDSIKIKSNDGAVVLTGTVASDSNKSLAKETVENLPGVKSVDNQLKLAADSPTEYSDGWITLKVKSVLMYHRNVSAIGTQVTTENGVVFLRGDATSEEQKELTAEYAQDVKGVKAVMNEMKIAIAGDKLVQTKAEEVDDASITAQVKTSLKAHNSTSATKTEIQTMDGVVTVSGIAKNAAEKSLVSKLVNDINGVTKVINNMTLGVAVK